MKNRISTKLIKLTNKVFKKVEHPFNMSNNGVKTYAMWQYEKGADTVRFFTDRYSQDEMFSGKRVLDMGCGAAGKSLYYASCGALSVVGVDIVGHYRTEAEALAEKLGLADKFTFVCASATELPFPDGSFDTIIMNDFMEHIGEPAGALNEALRLLSDGGRIYVNFPPYYHPTGAHLSDAINLPWCHLFFTEKQLITAYKELIHGVPDEKERLALRFSKDENGREHIGYINKMTLSKFKKLIKQLGIEPVYYREVPLRKFLTPLAKLPCVKEMFVKMAAVAIEKK